MKRLIAVSRLIAIAALVIAVAALVIAIAGCKVEYRSQPTTTSTSTSTSLPLTDDEVLAVVLAELIEHGADLEPALSDACERIDAAGGDSTNPDVLEACR